MPTVLGNVVNSVATQHISYGLSEFLIVVTIYVRKIVDIHVFLFAETFDTQATTLCIYRLFFHPLSKYPGPFLAKITNARAAYYGIIGDHHLDVAECHKRYGTIKNLQIESSVQQ